MSGRGARHPGPDPAARSPAAVRCITLHQPYASLVMAGLKPFETRSWPAPKTVVGHRIGVHAAAALPREIRALLESNRGDELRELCSNLPDWNLKRVDLGLPRKAILGTAHVAASLPMVGSHDRSPFDHNGEDRLFVHHHPMWGVELHRTNMAGGPPINLTARIPSVMATGHFEPGRWAWELLDPEPWEPPAPAVGKQRIWTWEPDE